MNDLVDWFTDDWRLLARLVDTRIEGIFDPLPSPYAARRDRRFADVARLVYDHLKKQGIEYETSVLDLSPGQRFLQGVRLPERVKAGRKGNCVELALIFAGYCLVAQLRPILLASKDHVLVAVWLDDEVGALDRGGHMRMPPEDHEFIDQGYLNESDVGRAKDALLARVAAGAGGATSGGAFLIVEPTAYTATDGVGYRTFDDACAQGRGWLARQSTVLQGLVDVGFVLKQYGDHRGRRWQPRPDRLGGKGRRRLAEALERLPKLALPVSSVLDRHALVQLSVTLRDESEAAAQEVSWLAGNLALVLETTLFLRAWRPRVTISQLWKAAADVLGDVATEEAGHGAPFDIRFADQDVIAWVALNSRAEEREDSADEGGGGVRRALVEFVVQLAADLATPIGTSVQAPTDGELAQDLTFQEWVGDLDLNYTIVNDIIQKVSAWRRPGPWRLVISLHSPDDEWPEEVQAWLVDSAGKARWEIPHSEPSRQRSATAVAAAVGRVLEWAREQASELEDVDLAVPTSFLGGDGGQSWRPEEMMAGGNRPTMLGQDYHVAARWSRRLNGGENIGLLQQRYNRIMKSPAAARVSWRAETDPDVLDDLLQKGKVPPVALGLSTVLHDGSMRTMLDLLLEESPIVLWPDQNGGAPTSTAWDAAKHALDAYWGPDVPRQLSEAYRLRRWGEPEASLPLALVRAVWEDIPWLEFCKSRNRRAAGAARVTRKIPQRHPDAGKAGPR
ncbi:hypothetical protein I6A84_21680 [Frankia sp. CNm7]|uniref:Uncharacterized protein n=1 Tax=Frankia nepalensis TaxID=1836974 RepID=A0A937RPJ1_9ACTN|nr:hypothetical protein [Frankia nepalensis]MBL7496193.1 hypothetical protein [Frankia nepalensis]MBL7511603.1 hypothetical protein [Frankia nepalensis]MBL7520627.1 hypothetical protein [Frankia nepalensis]MBL7630278.1 hypothetical protein [Frankia nepalensis]